MIMEWLDVGWTNMERKLDPPLYMGLTLKSLLEKSDVLNTVNAALKATKDDEKKGEDPWESVDGQSAFLGPTLWDRDMFYDGDLKMEYMDLDEFLNEAAVPLVGNQQATPPRVELSPLRPVASPPTINNDPILISADLSEVARTPESPGDRHIDSPSCSIPDPIISAPVKKTTSRTAKKQQLKPLCSSPTPSTDMDLSMSSDGFGSRYSRYDDDDLSPQPMSKKSKKQYVPDDMKDDKYWARRRKNNLAAKRSRDARRMKENQIAVRAVILEKENAALKEEVERLRKENQQLKMARK